MWMATWIPSHHWSLLLTPKSQQPFLFSSKCFMRETFVQNGDQQPFTFWIRIHFTSCKKSLFLSLPSILVIIVSYHCMCNTFPDNIHNFLRKLIIHFSTIQWLNRIFIRRLFHGSWLKSITSNRSWWIGVRSRIGIGSDIVASRWASIVINPLILFWTWFDWSCQHPFDFWNLSVSIIIIN